MTRAAVARSIGSAQNEGRGTHRHARRRHSRTLAAAIRPVIAAQEQRPGHARHAPRRHQRCSPYDATDYSAQRRPGHAPRRHSAATDEPTGRLSRSTKAGARTPTTRVQHRIRGFAHPRRSNEGRGTQPGDTPRNADRPSRQDAQRRPGHATRRHGVADDRAARTNRAQRRPGHATRRHSLVAARVMARQSAAQRRPGHAPRRHLTRTAIPARSPPLKRRPGHVHPGDTLDGVVGESRHRRRSTITIR